MWETNWDPGTWRIEILNFVGHFWMQVNWKITQFVKHKNTYRFNRGMVLEEILNRICQTRRITVRGGGRGIRGMKNVFSDGILYLNFLLNYYFLIARGIFIDCLLIMFSFFIRCSGFGWSAWWNVQISIWL